MDMDRHLQILSHSICSFDRWQRLYNLQTLENVQTDQVTGETRKHKQNDSSSTE
jgi:hypothetical protein